ncbi:13495_t:CDS:2, partial [Funneliformis geosporum]
AEMIAAMITDNTTAEYEDYEQATEILKKLNEIKNAPKSDATIQKDEVKRELDEKITELSPEEKTEFKNDFAPVIALANVLKAKTKPEEKELGNLIIYNELAYRGDENLKDLHKKEKLQEQLKNLKKYTETSGEKHALFSTLSKNDQLVIKKMVNRMQAKVSEMRKVQSIEPNHLPTVSIPVILSIGVLTMALVGATFYFLQGISNSKRLGEKEDQ